MTDRLEDLNPGLGGRYELFEVLGAGGMATVYRARDLRHDREVALKILSPDLSVHVGPDRFLREVRITAGLTHPNILPLLDSGQLPEGRPYYVMPLIRGESLRQRLQREPQLPAPEACSIAADVAAALDAAHRAGVIHRDIKPENILLQDGRALVADFGIARALDASSERLTSTGLVVGTPAYMSPEQAGGAAVDGRADLYALGCVLYEMLAGTAPFGGASAQAIIARHAVDPVPPLRTIRPDLSPALEHVLLTALAKSPADRPATGAEFATSLTAALVAPAPSPRRRWPVLLSSALVVAIAAGLFFRSRGSSAPTTIEASDLPPTRIAVLPMANTGGDTASDPMAQGLTEELIATLGSVSDLRVLARSAVARFAGSTRSATDIGRELHAGSVLESSIRRAGDRVRITVSLVDVTTAETRWSERYDRHLAPADLFAIQSDVAERVAQALRVRLAGPGRATRQPTEDLQAYEQYLRARVLFSERAGVVQDQGRSLDSAIALLRDAIERDGSFAMARATLAKVYVSKLFLYDPSPALHRAAEREIASALALDSTLAEAYHARGDLVWTRVGGWQHEAALRDYMRALILRPNLVDAHGALGSLLFHNGLLAEARRELEITLELDPSNQFVPPRLPRVAWYQGKYDSALAGYQALRRATGRANVEEALVLAHLDRTPEGLALLDALAPTGEWGGDAVAMRALLLARMERTDSLDILVAEAERRGGATSHFHHAEFVIACAYALAGRKKEAMRWLERTAADGMPAYELFASEPFLDSLRGDAAFERFLGRLKTDWERFRGLMRNP